MVLKTEDENSLKHVKIIKSLGISLRCTDLSCTYPVRDKHDLNNHLKTCPGATVFTKVHDTFTNRCFLCPICEELFPLKIIFDAHIVSQHYNTWLIHHVTSTIYECELCEVRTVHKETMIEHVQNRNANKITHCYICGKLCRSLKDLKRHIQTTFHPPNLYECEFCHLYMPHQYFVECHKALFHANSPNNHRFLTSCVV